MKKLFAFHLLNDFSGSPKVLSQVLPIWLQNGYEVHLYTSYYQEGFLTNLLNVNYHRGWYKFSINPIIRLVFYSLSQLILIAKMYKKINSSDVIYINTVLPFGAAILGKLKGCQVIYHIHETTVNPKILQWFLFKIIKLTATKIINVSRYVENSHKITSIPNYLVYNSLDHKFLSIANTAPKSFYGKNVLMISSLKKYKGILNFISLARCNSYLDFKLVLNSSMKEINHFFQKIAIPSNLTLVEAQKNVHPFYQWADIILNLSIPDQWVETFGLTIIEGMAYGLPAIVPTVGGITEVIEEEKSGFKIDSQNIDMLSETLSYILSNKQWYSVLSNNSKKRISLFSESNFNTHISNIIHSFN